MLYLYLHIHKFKNNKKVLVLQNVPQPLCSTIWNFTLICEHLWCPERRKWILDTRKDILLGQKLLHSQWEKEFDKFIIWFLKKNLFLIFKSYRYYQARSFSYVNSTLNHNPLWHLYSVASYIVGIEEMWNIPPGSNRCYFQEWTFMNHTMPAICTGFWVKGVPIII